MALGGFNAGTWDATIPAGGEAVGLGDDRIRSVKTTLQQALDSEHVWPSAGGVVGQHRAGSARAFFGTQSLVSASDSSVVADGRMMIASDTTRLFAAGSGGKAMLGAGPQSLSLDSTTGINVTNSRWAMEVGVTPLATGTGEIVVTFPNSGFSGIPYLQTSIYTTHQNGAGDIARTFKLFSLTASGFTGQIVDTTNNVGVTNAALMWQSVGTRAL